MMGDRPAFGLHVDRPGRCRAHREETMARDLIRLLEVLPALGAGLSARALAEAKRMMVAPAVTLTLGSWDMRKLRRALDGRANLGCVITEGLIVQDLALGGRCATQLLGPGDLLATSLRPAGSLTVKRIHSVAEVTRLALLDASLPALARRWPSIVAVLLTQAERQLDGVAVQQLISQLPRADEPIVALMWHLADRWGQPEREGVVVPLTVGHEAIARLVGGRRSTVSASLGRLAHRNLVRRRPNGTWRVALASRHLFDDFPPVGPTPAVRLLGTPPRRPLAKTLTPR